MKFTPKMLIAILTTIALVVTGMEFFCRLGVKCKNCGMTSSSKDRSTADGFYLGEYKALTKKVKLKNHDMEVTFSDAWVEKRWFIQSDICLMRYRDIIQGEYNVIFPFQKTIKDVFLFSMVPIINGNLCTTCGGISEDSKQVSIPILPDTIEIQILEKNPVSSIGWSEGGLAGEKLKYVRIK